jgi:transcriptional regulator with XRE-family HTH domain
MATGSSKARVGATLRQWRERRRLTQLELALDAGTSTRHLSFVENGRSKPGRELLLRLAEQLEVPFRERNQLLLAAGHAPAFPERSLDDPALSPVRDALQLILTGHEPYPAVVVDRAWNLVAANPAVQALTEAADIDPELLRPPINLLRIGFHPRGLGPLIINLDEWRARFLERLERQVAMTGDEELHTLIAEIAGYPAPPRDPKPLADQEADGILGPIRIRAPDRSELTFFGMFATFDTPFDVTTSELAIELLIPANQATAEALKNLAHGRRET